MRCNGAWAGSAILLIAACATGESTMEEWTLGEDGLIARSLGHYDQAEYDRQLQFGVDGS